MYLFHVTLYYLSAISKPFYETHDPLNVVAADDVEARSKAVTCFKKNYRHDNGVTAPEIRRCEIAIVARIDVQ